MDTATSKTFQIHLLEDDEEPHPDEFWIRYSGDWFCDLDDVTVLCSKPLVSQVLEAKKKGNIPNCIAIEDVEAESTSAMAVAMGINVPLRVCLAATVYDRVGPHALQDAALQQIIHAYYGYLEDLLSDESGEAENDEMLGKIPHFWQVIMHQPERLAFFSNIFYDSCLVEQFGVEDIEVDDGLCLVYATAWAYPYGFGYADTVVMAQIDDEMAAIKVSVGTIATDANFMHELHAALCDAERNSTASQDRNWILCGGEYLKPPDAGTTLTIDEIWEIACTHVPPV